MQKNTPSQVPMEHSPGETTSWVTNQTSVNWKKLKSYQASSLTTMLWDQISITRKQNFRNTNTWRLNNTFLNNQQVPEEIKRKIKTFLETNDDENMTIQNLWDAAKAVLWGKFLAIQSYFKKQEKHRIDNLTLHLKQLEKEEQKKILVEGKKS